MRTSTIGRAGTFAGAARCYWLEIFPVARRELREWRRRATAISEPGLRRDALLALQAKSGNAEGLAAFAVLAPRKHRRAVVRAVIAYQTALDYLDSLTERTSHSRADKLKLNGALEVAVDCELSLDTYREEIAQRGDGEYLAALVEACRGGLGGLPSYASARGALGRRARIAAESQAMNHSLLLGAEEEEIAEWARAAARASGLEGEGLPLVGGRCRRRLDPGTGRAHRARRATGSHRERLHCRREGLLPVGQRAEHSARQPGRPRRGPRTAATHRALRLTAGGR